MLVITLLSTNKNELIPISLYVFTVVAHIPSLKQVPVQIQYTDTITLYRNKKPRIFLTNNYSWNFYPCFMTTLTHPWIFAMRSNYICSYISSFSKSLHFFEKKEKLSVTAGWCENLKFSSHKPSVYIQFAFHADCTHE